MVDTNGEYLTTETPLATYLIIEGFTLLIIRYEPKKNGKQQAIFAFEDSPKLQEYISLYYHLEATVNISVYEYTKSSLTNRFMRGLP